MNFIIKFIFKELKLKQRKGKFAILQASFYKKLT